MIRAGVARLCVLVLAFACTAASSHEIFARYGSEQFAAVMLVAGIQQLLVFGDLGMGGVVINRTVDFAARAVSKSAYAEFLGRILRVQAAVLGTLAVSALIVLALAGRDWIATDPARVLAISSAAALVLANIPLSLGNRIFVGLRRPEVPLWIGGASPIIVLAVVMLISKADLNASLLYLAWPGGQLCASLITTLASLRALDLRASTVAHHVIHNRLVNRADPILKTSMSMLVVSIATPIAFASDRFIIAAFAGLSETAKYSVVAQLYFPALSVLNAVVQPLWGIDPRAERHVRARRWLFLLGIGGGGSLFLAAPLYANLVGAESGYQVSWLASGFAALFVANSLVLPYTMSFNRGVWLTFFASVVAVSAAVNLPLSVIGAQSAGAVGPVLASVGCLLVLQFVPMRYWSRMARE